jgi:hypothetical protein
MEVAKKKNFWPGLISDLDSIRGDIERLKTRQDLRFDKGLAADETLRRYAIRISLKSSISE